MRYCEQDVCPGEEDLECYYDCYESYGFGPKPPKVFGKVEHAVEDPVADFSKGEL